MASQAGVVTGSTGAAACAAGACADCDVCTAEERGDPLEVAARHESAIAWTYDTANQTIARTRDIPRRLSSRMIADALSALADMLSELR